MATFLPVVTEILIILLMFISPNDGRKLCSRSLKSNGVDHLTIKPLLQVSELDINSTIKWRYAITKVTSKVINLGNVTEEAVFTLDLPEEAFISNFTITVDNQTFISYVKEKDEATQTYKEALLSGQSAGHVHQVSRHSNRIRVAINIQKSQEITFQLIYEELLKRRGGLYEHVIDLRPGQVADNLHINVYIEETRNITILKVPEIRNNSEIIAPEKDNPSVNITKTGKFAHIVYTHTSSQQDVLSQAEVEVKLVVKYDIDRQIDGGEIQVVNGYFVHFFSPPIVEAFKKHVIFVVDVSHSMYGRKINQTKEAMSSFINKLNSEDLFNIITFSDSATSWSPIFPTINETTNLKDNFHETEDQWKVFSPNSATESVKSSAVNYITDIEPEGGTNINEALLLALQHFRNLDGAKTDNELVPMVIFLTDGYPSQGIIDKDEIVKNVKSRNTNIKVPIFSLAFGSGADYDLLKKISLQNFGFTRKIYEASDAKLQLERFYEEIAAPLLADVNITYLGDVPQKSVTKTNTKNYFGGSEITVLGRVDIRGKSTIISSDIQAETRRGPLLFNATAIYPPVGGITSDGESPDSLHGQFLERLWAYLTIKNLIDDQIIRQNQSEENRMKALKLAIQYNFVTPITSLVVIKPGGNQHNTTKSINGTEEVQLIPSDVSFNSEDNPSVGIRSPFIPQSGFPHFISGNEFSIDVKPPSENISSAEEADETVFEAGNITWSDQILRNRYIRIENSYLDLSFNQKDIADQNCTSSNGLSGICVHVHVCNMTAINEDFTLFVSRMCVKKSISSLERMYLGVCCFEEE